MGSTIDCQVCLNFLVDSLSSSIRLGVMVVDRDDLTPNSFRSSIKAFDTNWGPRSDMILSGSPKRLYRFSNNSCAVSSVVIVFEHGIRIIPFVNPWSTTMRMESCPFTGGRSVMKSIEQFTKGRVVGAPSVGRKEGFVGCQSILNC